MTTEHLRPLLDMRSRHLFFRVSERLARAQIPEVVADLLRLGRIMVLSKPEYALTTTAGCECVAHVLQGLTEVDPLATVTSIGGISAFDLISRLFYGRPSEYRWEDASGEVHKIDQSEGGE